MPIFYVSASDGTNVVKLFNEAIRAALKYKKNPTDFVDNILEELQVSANRVIFRRRARASGTLTLYRNTVTRRI